MQYSIKEEPSTISTCADLLSVTTSKKCSSEILEGKNEKTLDAPNYRDDFYLNNIDWSSTGPIAIALDTEVYLYSPSYTV